MPRDILLLVLLAAATHVPRQAATSAGSKEQGRHCTDTLAACDGFDMGLKSWQWRSLELVRLVRIFRYSRMKKTISQWEDIMQVG